MSNDRDRVISISLSEKEWQAFVARQPQPVDWLRERIRDEVNNAAEGQQERRLAVTGSARP
jgi:hypothetical protein